MAEKSTSPVAAAKEELPLFHPDHPDNPNVLATALSIYKASYRDSQPSDNPMLWLLHVDHARKLMKGMIQVAQTKGQAASSASPEQIAAAKRQEDILKGVITLGDQVVAVPPATAPTAAQDLAPAATESKTAKEKAIEAGIVKPGTFDAP